MRPKSEAHIPKAEKSVLFSLVNKFMESLSCPRQGRRMMLTFLFHRSGSLKCCILMVQLGEHFSVCVFKGRIRTLSGTW